jgi:hypothetical protein
MNAGPTTTIINAGNTHNTVGNTIFIANLAECSSIA